MKYRILPLILAIIFSGILFGTAFGVASAHTLETDGQISAWIHSDPNDILVVKQTSVFHIYFLTPPGFNAHDYSYSVNIHNTASSSDTSIQDLSIQNNTTLSFNYLFPNKGNYVVTVDGKPVSSSTLPSFSLVYDDENVERTSQPLIALDLSHLTHAQHFLHYLFFIPLIIVVFGMIIYDKIKRRKNK